MDNEVTKKDFQRLLKRRLMVGEIFEKWWNKPHLFFNYRSPKQLVESGRGNELMKFIKEYLQ
jgi:uncharacterized protein (DUF2384 family)